MSSLIEQFSKSILTGSAVMQGRFALLEGYGNDLNADNSDDPIITNTIAAQKWTRKYPCTVMMPMRRISTNTVQNTARYQVQMFFCDTTFYEATGTIKTKNPLTNTSKVSIKDVQEKMEKCAVDYYAVLQDKIYDDLNIRKNIRTVKANGFSIDPFSMKNNDAISGVTLNFQLDIAIGCNVSDYFNNHVTIADYATFNSDIFLDTFCTGGKMYGYEVVTVVYDGSSLPSTPRTEYSRPDIQHVPLQEGDRITIPNHTLDNEYNYLSYDANFIKFINSTSVAKFIKFRPSPFNHINEDTTDAGFPSEAVHVEDVITGKTIYGEGFQIEWPYGKEFRFTVKYWYYDGSSWTKQHEIVFNERVMNIDGGEVSNANLKSFKEYVF